MNRLFQGIFVALCWVVAAPVQVVFAAGAASSALPDSLLALQPTKASPVKLEGVETVGLRKAYEQWLTQTPPEKLGKHPLADDFPGSVSASAARVTKKVTIDPAISRWHSTGLYAAPGEVITIVVPQSAVAARLGARIGAHKDRLWGYKPTDKWERFPQLDFATKIEATTTRLACPFGGLVYIDVPEGLPATPFDVSIANAVEAPLFVLGKTDPKAWAASIRNRPGPWAELACKTMIVTVPSKDAALLDDPTELLKTWEKCMAGCAELAGRPCHKNTPERFVVDRQISAGWMHSGYPIMAHLASTKEIASLKDLQAGPWALP